MKNPVALFVIALAAVAPVGAQMTVDRTWPLEPQGLVEVENIAGSVEITGWDGSEVVITGTLGANVEELDVSGNERRVSIEVTASRRVDDLESHLKIMVPAGASAYVETVSADITVADVQGTVELESVSGKVIVRARPIELAVETVSGPIEIQHAASRTELASVSGAIVVQEADGELDVESVSSSIDVQGGQLRAAAFETVSGSISFAADMVGQESFDFESMSGTVTLMLPASVIAYFEVSTFSGSINNAFGQPARRTSKYTSEQELDFSTGDDGPQISVSTFSGSVVLKKR